LRGVDLSAISALATADAPPADAAAAAAALEQGETPVTKLESGIAVERGVLTASQLAIVTPAATANGSLSLDLLAWEAEGSLQATSVERPELPAVEIRIEGPLDAPGHRVDAEALVAALAPPEPEPEPEPAPQPQPEPAAPAVAIPAEPVQPAPAEAVQPAPAEPVQPAPAAPVQPAPAAPVQPAPEQPAPGATALQPAPAAEPEPQPGADVFVKGILEKLKKPTQP
jgi:hypothetical protein